MSLYIGLISGTSMDGVDAALVDFDSEKIVVVGALTVPYPAAVHAELVRSIRPDERLTLHEIASLDITVGRWFARAVSALLKETDTVSSDVVAIGSHGQTLRHSPDTDPPYSIQIGDPATIAIRCSITTVADFRALDLAAGGQGAPLVPAFHAAYFRSPIENTVVVNIGGIANITVLPSDPNESIEGFDTGPGNCLLDDWIWHQLKKRYDENGRWAASGQASKELLEALLADDYIRRQPAKSTGREYFNLAFLTKHLNELPSLDLAPNGVQATLADFTVASIVLGIEQAHVTPDRILICGGGVKNNTLVRRLRESLSCSKVLSTSSLDIDPDAIEASAFAWLAMQRLESKPVQLTTGSADRTQLLGAVYVPSV